MDLDIKTNTDEIPFMPEYELILLKLFAEIIVDETISDKVRELRFNALRMLQGQLNYYKNLDYMDRLIDGIAKKKTELIMKAKTKTAMERIINPKAPYYNGETFVSDEHLTPEEELIAWSQASFQAPLSSVGYQRYKELFIQLFPEESKKLNLGGT